MGVMPPTDPRELKKLVDQIDRQLGSAQQNLLIVKEILRRQAEESRE